MFNTFIFHLFLHNIVENLRDRDANVVSPYKKIIELFINVDRIQGLHHEILLKLLELNVSSKTRRKLHELIKILQT